MSSPDAQRRADEEAQREQQRRQHRLQQDSGIVPSPPPYEVPETPLERLGPGFGYLLGVIAAAFLVNLAILWAIALQAGG
jgi:hypothetical protein